MNPLSHVAIIMDGNGRWGLNKKKTRNFGHKKGLNTIEKIAKHSIKKRIKFLTLFTFSTENWKRPLKEINFIFSLLENFIDKKLVNLDNQGICLKFIGRKKNLRKSLISKISKSENLTKYNKKLQINIALNYGSKIEILDSIKKLKIKKLAFTEKNLENNLYTKDIPPPDLLIRTGNTHRLSNFLLWQLAYSEIFFEKKLWPDFTEKDFDTIINKFIKIKRKFGGLYE
jgi:undecaprenyl diphosphate synthase